ncbi:MAG TPA: ABC transporter permease [Vicinamibacterales bacterium]
MSSDARRAGWADDVRRRLSPLALSPEREAEIVDELVQHLDDRFRELVDGGASAEEADRSALAEFRQDDVLARYMAPLRQAQQPPRVTPGVPASRVFGDLWQDVRYAVRGMLASPVFTGVAVLSLALGIGGDTAIFSVWNSVLHASLPGVREPQQLVMLTDPDATGMWNGRTDGPRDWLTYGEFEELRDAVDAFSGVMASQSSLNTWGGVRVDASESEQINGRLVSGGFFQVLGARAAIGRLFTRDEDRVDAPFAVLSHTYWQRRFGGRLDVLGKTLTISRTPLTIIGVAERGFIGETSGQQPDIWVPLRMQPRVLPGTDRLHDTAPEKTMWLHVFGRLKPGATPAQAETQSNAVFRAGLETFYGPIASAERRRDFLNQRLVIHPAAGGASQARTEFSQSLTTLLVAVAVLLLIACANLANLLLARGAARRDEMVLRLALGASRGRLVRQLATESFVLAALGGIAATAIMYVLHRALVQMLQAANPDFFIDFRFTMAVLVFALVATAAAAVAFGLPPAWQMIKMQTGSRLIEHSRGAIGSARQLRSGRWLVGAQLALSLPLLVGAGLLVRTVYNLQHPDLGFRPERLVIARIGLNEVFTDVARRDRDLRELRERIARIPGVEATTFSQLGLFSGGVSSASIEVEGSALKTDREREYALDRVGADYFGTLGIPIRVGRDISDGDRSDSPKVCVVNDAFVRLFFDGRSPLGFHVTTIDDSDRRTSYEIVGVAGNARTQALRGDVRPRFYVPAEQLPSRNGSRIFLIRTASESTAVTAAIRQAIAEVDNAMTLAQFDSLGDRLAGLTAEERALARVVTVFGVTALLLATIGLYGVLSYSVAKRAGEIAIRLALGAPSSRVVSMILGETIGLVVVGLTVGGALAYAASRMIGSRLYGVAPHDPLTLVAATGLLLTVALIAAYVPAVRASRLNPMTALRQS